LLIVVVSRENDRQRHTKMAAINNPTSREHKAAKIAILWRDEPVSRPSHLDDCSSGNKQV
jgi:hypothetical protein